MKLSSMRFKDYVWPHNPRTYEISYQRDVALHRVPFGNYVLQGMGRRNRIMRGAGEFVGPGAYAEFKKLATVFYETTPGVLIHPLWDTTSAYFVSLRLNQEPTEEYVSYSFEFWECFDSYQSGLVKLKNEGAGEKAAAPEKAAAAADEEYYTAVWGDCLWNIAIAHGLTLNELLALNPQIKNPNLLYVGDRVRVR